MTSLDILKATYAILPKAHQRKIIGLGILMLIVGFSELVLAGVISLLGVALSSPESLHTMPYVGNFLQKMPVFFESAPIVNSLTIVLGLVVSATIIKNIGTAYSTFKQNEISQIISWDVGIHAFKESLYMTYSWHTKQNIAELQSVLSWKLQLAHFWTSTIAAAAQLIIMLCLMLGAFLAAPWVSLLLYGVCGVLAVITYKFSRKKIRYLSALRAKYDIDSAKVSYFALQGIRDVQMYKQQSSFLKQYANFSQPYTSASAHQSVYPYLPQWLLETSGLALLLLAVLLMQWQNENIVTITGTLTLMAGISWRLLPAMNKLVSSSIKIREYLIPSEKLIKKFFHLQPPFLESQHNSFSSSLRLENISFCYPDTTQKALNNITMSIEKGSMIGLVGLSGAGKSTLVSVLTGLLQPTSGRLILDGKEVHSSPGFLHIGYVPQSPYIVDASLAHNIAFADWGKSINEKRVRECCHMAAITFLDELENDIYTELGERGVRLSGGQMQRVAIARALYTNPDILFFDEATSALDAVTEAAIQKTILSLRKDMTIVMIAHRLTTVEECQKIYWLHNGELKQVNDEGLLQYKAFLNEQITSKS